ncbi:MAG: ABC transporter substrate-binding protein [Burkholderiaceae bacterium]
MLNFNRHRRAAVLAVSFASALLAAPLGAGAQQAAQPVTIRANIIPILDAGAFHAAQKLGYFAAEGLNVVTTTGVTGAIGIPGLVAGAYDVVYTNLPSAYQAMQQGIDIKLIAVGNRTDRPGTPPDNAGLVKLASSSFKTGKDLEGKSVGVSARFNIQWLLAREWIRATGGNPDKVNYREVQFPLMIDALKTRQVDVIFASNPFLSAALRDPDMDALGWPFRTVLSGGRAAGYVVTQQMIQQRPEAVLAFARALAKGADWINGNNKSLEFRSMMTDVTKMKPEILENVPILPNSSTIDAEVLATLQNLAAMMKTNGLLNTDLDLSTRVFPALK